MIKIAGIDVGGTYIKAGLAINPPEVEDFKSIATQHANLVEQLIEIAEEYEPEALGIGVPGIVANGVLYSSPNLPEIKNLKLEEILKTRLKIPVRVANDAGMSALGEWKYGVGKGTHNLLLLTLGTGIGGGLILADKLYTGAGFAGEVGHIIIDPNGPPCGCGGYGCLESFVGSRALEQRAIQGIEIGIKTSLSKFHSSHSERSEESHLSNFEIPKQVQNDRKVRYKKITPKIISEEAYRGDEFARSIIEIAGYYLGIGIAGLCAVLDPDIVVLGGGVSQAGEILFNKIKEEMRHRLYLRKEIPIVPAKLGDHGGILGSALYMSKQKAT